MSIWCYVMDLNEHEHEHDAYEWTKMKMGAGVEKKTINGELMLYES